MNFFCKTAFKCRKYPFRCLRNSCKQSSWLTSEFGLSVSVMKKKKIMFLYGKDIQSSQEVLLFAFVGSWHVRGVQKEPIHHSTTSKSPNPASSSWRVFSRVDYDDTSFKKKPFYYQSTFSIQILFTAWLIIIIKLKCLT